MTAIDLNTPEMSPELARYVSHFARSVRWRRLVQRSTEAADVACLWLLISCFADRLLALSSGVRLTNEAAVACLLAGLVAPRVWRMTRQIIWIDAAEILEQQDRRFAGRLVTTVSTGLQPERLRGSPSMRRSIEAEVIALTLAGPPVKRSRSNRHRASVAILALFAVTFAIVSVLHRQTTWGLLVRQLAPLADQPPVTAAMLRVSPGDISRLAGESFIITAHADGLDDALPVLSYTLGDAPPVSVTMPATRDGYAFEFAALDQPLRYRIRAGNALSRWFTVKLIPPTRTVAPPPSSQPATTDSASDDKALMDAYLKMRSKLPR